MYQHALERSRKEASNARAVRKTKLEHIYAQQKHGATAASAAASGPPLMLMDGRAPQHTSAMEAKQTNPAGSQLMLTASPSTAFPACSTSESQLRKASAS